MECCDEISNGGQRYRSVEPAVTLERIRPIFDRIGITRIANITHLDVIGIPVYQCIRPNSRTLSVSQGKGTTPVAAKVSAAMESIEAWHAERPAGESRIASINDLNEMGIQYVPVRPLKGVGAPICNSQEMEWLAGVDLLTERITWVPAEVVSLDRTPDAFRHPGRFRRDSLGLASGNGLYEAILHGLFEHIERHAYAKWLESSEDALGQIEWIALDSIRFCAPRYLIEKVRLAGCSVYIGEIPCALGFPCFQCLIMSNPSVRIGPAYSWGMSCHADAETALIGAITEAAQTRLTIIAGSRDDLTADLYEHFFEFGQLAAFREKIEGRYKFLSEWGDRPSAGDLKSMLDTVLARLQQAGCTNVCAVELTNPTINIPVVKMVVTGLSVPRY